MGREENVSIFNDTEKLCKTSDRLKESLNKSRMRQYFLAEEAALQVLDKQIYRKPCWITVSKKRTLEAAAAYKGEKVCVLNFASATNPGGGVTRGSSAQEECICRVTVSDDVVNTTVRAKKCPIYGLFRGFGYLRWNGKKRKSETILHFQVHFYPFKHIVLPKSSLGNKTLWRNGLTFWRNVYYLAKEYSIGERRKCKWHIKNIGK